MKLPIAVVLFGCSLLGTWAKATTIDFEAQGAGAPAFFTGHTNSPLSIGIATLTGGQVLRNEAGGVDVSAVYASTSQVSGSYTDPLTISFAQAVSGFSILVTDEIPDTYTVKDDRGSAATAFVDANTNRTFSLVDSGIRQVQISSATASLWDFAIDNISFTAVPTAVPEPVLFPMIGVAFGALLFLRRRLQDQAV